MSQYPNRPILDPSRKYKRGVIAALRAYRANRPWSGTQRERRHKMRMLHAALEEIYGRQVSLRIVEHAADNGSYNRTTNTITIYGKLSVLTFLHEWAHALHGSSEYTAVSWSVTLFARVWPRKAARMISNATSHRLTAR